MQERILIVDDDGQLTSTLRRFFEKHGYHATTAATAKEFFALAETQSFDLVVLDLILPDLDGLEVALRFRKSSDIPIIMLSARGEVYDRIVGLEIGADDYVTKPFEPRELLARVKSVLRRYGGGKERQRRGKKAARYIRFNDVELDLVTASARRKSDSADLGLTSTEFALLKALAETTGGVLSRDAILASIYGNSVRITDRAIDTHIVRLRKKLANEASEDSIIRTVHGVGYLLAAEVERT